MELRNRLTYSGCVRKWNTMTPYELLAIYTIHKYVLRNIKNMCGEHSFAGNGVFLFGGITYYTRNTGLAQQQATSGDVTSRNQFVIILFNQASPSSRRQNVGH